ncbi:hypothetical protein CA601_44160 [Paraburkholderia hospita]|nr:hypothetical protein CA601_44160 [Paraburkholderia hospita]
MPNAPTHPLGNRDTRLSRQHFTLYRGYFDGVSVEQLHRTYAEAGVDVRVTRRLIATLRDACRRGAMCAR